MASLASAWPKLPFALFTQICQSKDDLPYQNDIATGNEGIYVDPQDPRGSVYLYYTGPQSRYSSMTGTLRASSCTLKEV